METLEERRLLSTPHVLPAGPRESRPDYMASTMDGRFPTAPENFEWEYTSPKLVYPFDQAVAGVSNQTHSLMTLFNKVLLRHDPYPLSTSIDVNAGYGQRTTITSTDGGQSWSASLPDGYFWPAVDISLTTNGSAPNFFLTLTTVNGMAKFSLTWDGYTDYDNLGRVEYTGDGNTYSFYNLGSDGYYVGPDESAQGTPVPLSNPTFNAAGDTATFQLPTDLPIGNYEAILSSPGITELGGSNHLDGDATTTELDEDHEDFVYPFFIMPGDANHDRTINIDDYGRIDGHYPATSGYINGDFNYDGIIDPDDYFIINHNFGTVIPAMPTEPNTLSVFTSRDAQNVAQMTLNWNPPTDVPDIDGFGVWCSTDGGVTFNFLQFVNDGSASSWTHTGLLDGTKYTYRIRAHSPTGGYSTTSNKAWAVTNLPSPENVPVTNITGTSLTLTWDAQASTQTGYEIYLVPAAGSPRQLLGTAPADATSFDVSGLTEATQYGFQVQAVSSTAGQSSAPAAPAAGPVTTPHDPTSDWTTVYGGTGAPSYVGYEWAGGQTRVDMDGNPIEDGHGTNSFVYGNGTLTLTLSDLPRHKDGSISIYLETSVIQEDDNSQATFELTIGDKTCTGYFGLAEYHDSGDNRMRIDRSFYFNGLDEPFTHTDKQLTISIKGSGFAEGYDSYWYVGPCTVSTFLPFVTISGSGTAIEDGSGDGQFTVTRSGSGTLLDDPLDVRLKDVGAGGDAAAGVDYQPITSISIEDGNTSGTKVVDAINDDEAEGVRSIYLAVADSSEYGHAATTTSPATGPTTAKVAKDDDVSVKEIRVKAYNEIKSYKDFDFKVEIDVTGEHLDHVDLQQDINQYTRILDPATGAPWSEAQVAQKYPADAHPNTDGEFILDWKDHLVFENGVYKMWDEQAEVDNSGMHMLLGGQDVHYTYLKNEVRQFRIFAINSATQQTLKMVNWSYSWDNYAAKWLTTDNPPVPEVNGMPESWAVEWRNSNFTSAVGIENLQ